MRHRSLGVEARVRSRNQLRLRTSSAMVVAPLVRKTGAQTYLNCTCLGAKAAEAALVGDNLPCDHAASPTDWSRSSTAKSGQMDRTVSSRGSAVSPLRIFQSVVKGTFESRESAWSCA